MQVSILDPASRSDRHTHNRMVPGGFLAPFLLVTWSYFIQYVQEYAHEPEKSAGYLLTGTLAAFAMGRFSAAYLMRFLDPRILMGAYSLIRSGAAQKEKIPMKRK